MHYLGEIQLTSLELQIVNQFIAEGSNYATFNDFLIHSLTVLACTI
jgi:hypothetical protein